MRNADFNTADVQRCCERKLHIHFRDGKEAVGWFSLDGRRVARVTVPRGRKPLKPKTYKSIAVQLKLEVDELDDFLGCTIRMAEYLVLIRPRVLPQADR